MQRFFAKLNESTKLLVGSERTRIIFLKSLPIIGPKIWYRINVPEKLLYSSSKAD